MDNLFIGKNCINAATKESRSSIGLALGAAPQQYCLIGKDQQTQLPSRSKKSSEPKPEAHSSDSISHSTSAEIILPDDYRSEML